MARPTSKLVTAALAAVALFWPSSAESPVRAAPSTEPPPVRIEHQLIHVPSLVSRAPRRRFVPPATRLAVHRPQPAPSRKPDGFVVRAGRVLVGDGRYRPEPFPRPGR